MFFVLLACPPLPPRPMDVACTEKRTKGPDGCTKLTWDCHGGSWLRQATTPTIAEQGVVPCADPGPGPRPMDAACTQKKTKGPDGCTKLTWDCQGGSWLRQPTTPTMADQGEVPCSNPGPGPRPMNAACTHKKTKGSDGRTKL